MADPSTFSIVATTGNDRLDLKLRGRALPYQPLTFEGSMRAEFTWYPGNAVATVQMLGAEEKATTVTGMWKDRFIKSVTDEGVSVNPTGVALFNDQQVADVFDLASKVEQIRLAGQILRVEWDSLVREGILMRFRQTWKRREDLEWEMEFQWISRGEKQAPVSLPASQSPDTYSQQLRALLNNLVAAVSPPEFPVVEDLTLRIDAAVTEITSAVTEVESAVSYSVETVQAPVEASERALAATQTIVNQASEIRTAVEETPALFVISSTDRQSLGYEDALAADEWSRNVKDQAKAMQLTASEQADTLRTNARQEELIASFIARAPTDLRDVSRKYYGTPDQWRTLLQYNALESSKVDIGTLILVPKITAADRTV